MLPIIIIAVLLSQLIIAFKILKSSKDSFIQIERRIELNDSKDQNNFHE